MEECIRGDNDTCQHVGLDLKSGSWIIPSGTHMFFGHIVSVSTSGDSQDKPSIEQQKQEADNVAKDLVEVVGQHVKYQDKKAAAELIQALVMYIVDRDFRILQHGIRLGKDQHK